MLTYDCSLCHGQVSPCLSQWYAQGPTLGVEILLRMRLSRLEMRLLLGGSGVAWKATLESLHPELVLAEGTVDPQGVIRVVTTALALRIVVDVIGRFGSGRDARGTIEVEMEGWLCFQLVNEARGDRVDAELPP